MGKQKEVWKWIKGYEGLYQVSCFGRIRSMRGRFHKKIMKLSPFGRKDKWPYFRVSLSKGGYSKNLFVHRAVALSFIKPENNKPHVNHKDKNVQNNHYKNLEWVDQLENRRHSYLINNSFVGGHTKTPTGYFSMLRFKNVYYYLGHYKTKQEANIAYIMGCMLYTKSYKYLKS